MPVGNSRPLWNQSKQRRWERCVLDVPVPVSVYNSDHELAITGRGLVLSEGGMLLFAAANFPVGERVGIELRLPPAQTGARFSATIRNRTAYLYGIEFLTASAEQRRTIAHLTTAAVSS